VHERKKGQPSLLTALFLPLLRDPSDELSESPPQEIVDSDAVGCGSELHGRPPRARLPSAGKNLPSAGFWKQWKKIVSNVYPFLPKLTMNGQFIRDFIAAESPCIALGLLEDLFLAA
jgi:hypothetical protein